MSVLKRSLVAAAVTGVLAGWTGAAFGAGDWLVRFGGANVSPNDGSSGVVADDAVGVDSGTSVFVTAEYMLNPAMGVELLAAWPFSHDITLKGSGKIAETDHLPPTLSFNYHFNTDAGIRPYVGLGLNYTTFFSEDATAVISSIKLDDSWGLAVQAGVDADINDKWYFNAAIRYIDIETTATTNLGKIDVDIDPYVYQIGVGMRF